MNVGDTWNDKAKVERVNLVMYAGASGDDLDLRTRRSQFGRGAAEPERRQ